MIVEGIVTTLDQDDSVHVTPIGPTIGAEWKSLVIRPFKSSHTYANLTRTGEGVFHVTDDVELIARAAISHLAELPETRPCTRARGAILVNACRWYAFRIESVEEHPDRPSLSCRIVEHGFEREFLGLCRAKHAVVEAAILATRLSLHDADFLRAELQRLEPLVQKTGGGAEHRAWNLLQKYILGSQASSPE